MAANLRVNLLKRLGLLGIVLSVSAPGCSPKPVTNSVAQIADQYGCIPPEPSTFAQLGIDASLAQMKYKALAVGAVSVKTDPQVKDLLTRASRDAALREYLRCKALKQEGYNQEQAAYLDLMNAFLATSPSSDEFIRWHTVNPFPRIATKSNMDVTACDHLSVTAAWQGLQAPEQTNSCTYSAPDKCVITGTKVNTNSDNGGSQSTSLASDHRSLSAVVKATPDGSVLDRKRTWIDISVLASLQCEE